MGTVVQIAQENPNMPGSYYRARYYDPTTGRFLSEDPIGFVAGENFYSYVENDSLNFVDSFGLCSNDVKKIVNAARNAVNDMTLNGDRIYGGNLNNAISTLRKLNPFTKLPPYKGCGEQAENVINQTLPLIPSLECVWEPEMHYEFFTPQHGPPHQWVSFSTKGDPYAPTIHLDPWNNRYQLVPPGGPRGSVQNRPCGVTSKPAIAGPELYMLYLLPASRASLISDIFGYKLLFLVESRKKIVLEADRRIFSRAAMV